MSLNIVCSKCGHKHNTSEDVRRQKSYFGMVSNWESKSLNCRCCGKVLITIRSRGGIHKYSSTES